MKRTQFALAILSAVLAAQSVRAYEPAYDYGRQMDGVSFTARAAAIQARRKASAQKELNDYQNDLQNVDEILDRAKEGMEQIKSMPIEVAGLSILLVPGTPSFESKNPGKEALMDFTMDRKQYWEDRLIKLQEQENDVYRRLDPQDTSVQTDEDGVVMPTSLPRQLAGTYAGGDASRARDLQDRMKVLEVKQAALQAAIHCVVVVIKDNALDQAYIKSADQSEAAQALINRKVALLKDTVIPDLTTIRNALQNTLIPDAQSRLAR